jgi:hypothetical protein
MAPSPPLLTAPAADGAARRLSVFRPSLFFVLIPAAVILSPFNEYFVPSPLISVCASIYVATQLSLLINSPFAAVLALIHSTHWHTACDSPADSIAAPLRLLCTAVHMSGFVSVDEAFGPNGPPGSTAAAAAAPMTPFADAELLADAKATARVRSLVESAVDAAMKDLDAGSEVGPRVRALPKPQLKLWRHFSAASALEVPIPFATYGRVLDAVLGVDTQRAAGGKGTTAAGVPGTAHSLRLAAFTWLANHWLGTSGGSFDGVAVGHGIYARILLDDERAGDGFGYRRDADPVNWARTRMNVTHARAHSPA